MFKSSKLVFLNFIFLITVQICSSEPTQPHLSLYTPDDPEYTEVLVKRVGDNLTLTCEMKGDQTHRLFVWNYVAVNGSMHRPFITESTGPAASSVLVKPDMQLEDSGQYMCSAPPFSVTKFVLVQNRGIINCARGAFSCGARCVLPAYVCDGRADCPRGEDEAAPLCPPSVCQRPEMLNCSDGRCVPAAACCAAGAPLCLQPRCCSEHAAYSRAGEGFVDAEYPALYEDRRAPDDYGFIQSTIYTVTACALIFMIAAVLLVSAICKMHMKRAALRTYARAAAERHYSAHQTPRFPPCYEASRLLEQEAARAPPVADTAMQTSPESPGGGRARLADLFAARYRQVPTSERAVELAALRSPARAPRLPGYRSPAAPGARCLFAADTDVCGPELNGAGGARRERVALRRLTLHLGRLQLALPRLARRRPPAAPRDPDDNDTYTLNGRTIRLLGADFENYPRPPPYVARKPAGPPPAYPAPGAPPPPAEPPAEPAEPPPRYEDVGGAERVARATHALNVIRESAESLASAPPDVDE